MKYIRFRADEVEAINKFIEEHNDQIPEQGGIRTSENDVKILYSGLTDEEYGKVAAINSLQTRMIQLKIELAEHKQKEQFFRDCAAKKGEKDKETGANFGDLVVHHSSEQKRCLAEIHFYKEAIHLIESDAFPLE